jgi:hypothetical protein
MLGMVSEGSSNMCVAGLPQQIERGVAQQGEDGRTMLDMN